MPKDGGCTREVFNPGPAWAKVFLPFRLGFSGCGICCGWDIGIGFFGVLFFMASQGAALLKGGELIQPT